MDRHPADNSFDVGLEKQSANFVPLTPLSFLARAANVYPKRTAYIHRAASTTYEAFYARCRSLAASLSQKGIGAGDTVAIMSPNTPAMLEAHYGVPMCGAILNALNTALDPDTLAFILNQAEAKVLITDRAYSAVIKKVLDKVDLRPLVIDIEDAPEEDGERLGAVDYDELIAEGDPCFSWQWPEDEWAAISLTFTSGTTGQPKGAVYQHRAAYLKAIGNAIAWNLPDAPTYLWSLPMFHCNGWCFPWTISVYAGTHVCLREVDAASIYQAIAVHEVSHFCAAPSLLNQIVNAPEDQQREFSHTVQVMTAGAAPPAATLAAMDRAGFEVLHAYGMTEVLGSVVAYAAPSEWENNTMEEQAALKRRQGVPFAVLDHLTVADTGTFEPVPRDGETIGEVLMRGNTIMKGYLKNEQATSNVFEGGWYHTGDLGVIHEDGCIELKDRARDIIRTTHGQVSTIEVEDVLYKHPSVLEASVVAQVDTQGGETPCAFVTLKSGAHATADDVLTFCKTLLSENKAPKAIVFVDKLPRTSTGKVKKYVLRERANAL